MAEKFLLQFAPRLVTTYGLSIPCHGGKCFLNQIISTGRGGVGNVLFPLRDLAGDRFCDLLSAADAKQAKDQHWLVLKRKAARATQPVCPPT